jgi:hypothetical protein
MAIRWDQFPHQRLRLEIYARLARNHVARSSEDSLRHILRGRLQSHDTGDHRRYIEQEARELVEHLRTTRDVYRKFIESQGCRPAGSIVGYLTFCRTSYRCFDPSTKSIRVRRGLATNLHQLGVPDKTIQRVLRHSNVAVTQNCCIKTAGPEGAAAMQQFECFLEYAPDMHISGGQRQRLM